MRSKKEWANTFMEVIGQNCEECIAEKECRKMPKNSCLDTFALYCIWGKDEENVNDSEVEK